MSLYAKYKVTLPESDFGSSNQCSGIEGSNKKELVSKAIEHWIDQTLSYWTEELSEMSEDKLDSYFRFSLEEGFQFGSLPMVEDQ